MLKCRDVPAHAEQLMAGEMSAGQRLSLRMHLLMCAHCRRYVRQLRLLVNTLPAVPDDTTDEDIQRVLEKLDQKP